MQQFYATVPHPQLLTQVVRVAQEAAKSFPMQVEPRRSKRGRSGEDNTLASPEQPGNSPLDEPKPIKKGHGWVIVPV
ncbi:hypothetical protein M422DRAFT_276248 [Sphaerobolus stellatus SS14]|uniref:Uncharacterized protein n=1 Tax=Sphaerobolus stellatus (strain SS14) TaxID=990650 RepID=A0A0C9UDK6_SPHS4|nr:hypothetical protein M422DRAFT_276248 [Sphaerobolus stellatus SS14]